jgi:hypothetical protein
VKSAPVFEPMRAQQAPDAVAAIRPGFYRNNARLGGRHQGINSKRADVGARIHDQPVTAPHLIDSAKENLPERADIRNLNGPVAS